MSYIPCGSLVAALLVYCGIGIFCGATLTAFGTTEDMFSIMPELKANASRILSAERIGVLVVTPAMVLMTLLYIIFGFLATKQRKVQVYDDRKVICGGKTCITISLCFAYLVTIVWVIIAGFSFLPTVFMFMVSRYVRILTPVSTGECLDLWQYGFVKIDRTLICGEDLKLFGEKADQVCIMYGLVSVGCLLIIIGMLHFLLSISSNLSHVTDGLKRIDYEKRRQEDQNELQEIGTRSSNYSGPRARPYDASLSQVSYNRDLNPISAFGDHGPRNAKQTVSTERLAADYY